MGWLDERRESKEKHQYEQTLSLWQIQLTNINDCLDLAKTYNGEDTDAIVLRLSERLYFSVANAGLIEARLGPGHWQGASSGISVPIGHIGHNAIRYHIGSSKGSYVQGTPHDSVIDSGTVYMTNQRLVFEGSKQTRECLFSKLIGYTNDDEQGSTTISISNRQKPITISYGKNLAPAFAFRLALALAHYRQTLPQFMSQLETALVELQASKPPAPSIQTK